MNYVIHADDFGYAKSINKSIIELCDKGILNSVSIMANMPYSKDCIELCKYNNILFGLHATFTQGKPITNPELIPTLVNENGLFLSMNELSNKAKSNRLSIDEIVLELKNQFLSIKENLGDKLIMIDCHHGLHLRIKQFIKAFQVAGQELNIKIIRTAPYYYIYKIKHENHLFEPKLSNILKFGIRKVLINYIRKYIISEYKKKFIVFDGFIVKDKGVNNIFEELMSVDQSRYNDKYFILEAHPATSVEELKETRLIEQRLSEYNTLLSKGFFEYIFLTDKFIIANFLNIKR